MFTHCPVPIPLGLRSRAYVFGRLIPNSNGAEGRDVLFFCVPCVRGFCDKPITRPQLSHPLWVCVCVWEGGVSHNVIKLYNNPLHLKQEM